MVNDLLLHTFATWCELNGFVLEDGGYRYKIDSQNHPKDFLDFLYKTFSKPEKVIIVKCPSYHYAYTEESDLHVCGTTEKVESLNISKIEKDFEIASNEIFEENIFRDVHLEFVTYPYEWLEIDHLRAKDAVRYQYLNAKRISDI